MNAKVTQIIVLSFALVLFVSACSRKAESGQIQGAGGANLPGFAFAARDIASPVTVATNTSGNLVVDIRLSGVKAEELRKFTQEHVNQRVQIMFGAKVLARPKILDEISNGEVEETFASSASNQAWAVADLLNRK